MVQISNALETISRIGAVAPLIPDLVSWHLAVVQIWFDQSENCVPLITNLSEF